MRSRIITPLVVAGLALTASCGKDEPAVVGSDFTDLPVASIELDAEMDMFALQTLHFEGHFTRSYGEVLADLSISKSGDCSGTLTIDGRGTEEILEVDSTMYIRGDDEFWKAYAGAKADDMIARVGDRWLKLSGSNEGLVGLCDLTRLVRDFHEEDADAKGEIAEVNGVPAIELTSQHSGYTSHNWVAIDVPHYVVKTESEGGDQPGTMLFTDFDKELNLSAPAADEIADVGQ